MMTVTSYSLVRRFQRDRTGAVSHANACAFPNPPKGANSNERERWADRWLAFHANPLRKGVGESVLSRLEHAVAWARQCDQEYIGDSTIRTDDLDIAVTTMRRAAEKGIAELIDSGTLSRRRQSGGGEV